MGLLLGAVVVAPIGLDALDARRERLAAEPHPIAANDAEQSAIVAALLRRHGSEPVGRPLVVDATARLCGRSEPPPPTEACSEGHHGGVPLDGVEVDDMPLKLRRELVLANQDSRTLSVAGLESAGMVSSAEVERIFSRGVMPGWDAFRAAHPNAAGFQRFSIAVLTPDRRQALIFASHSCGGLCGDGALFRLERVGDEWNVVAAAMLWIS